jgi:mevalonate pyrophosphate decarboxylase
LVVISCYKLATGSEEPTTKTSCCSSGVEHFLGKEEVEGSIPFNSSAGLELKIFYADIDRDNFGDFEILF